VAVVVVVASPQEVTVAVMSPALVAVVVSDPDAVVVVVASPITVTVVFVVASTMMPASSVSGAVRSRIPTEPAPAPIGAPT
jgi:hypothetical protein